MSNPLTNIRRTVRLVIWLMIIRMWIRFIKKVIWYGYIEPILETVDAAAKRVRDKEGHNEETTDSDKTPKRK
jgi:hypothetical protein